MHQVIRGYNSYTLLQFDRLGDWKVSLVSRNWWPDFWETKRRSYMLILKNSKLKEYSATRFHCWAIYLNMPYVSILDKFTIKTKLMHEVKRRGNNLHLSLIIPAKFSRATYALVHIRTAAITLGVRYRSNDTRCFTLLYFPCFPSPLLQLT